MTIPDNSPHVMRARASKAGRIARLLTRFDATPEEAHNLPELGRRMAEELAGVPVSSESTWALVGPMLEALATVPSDPFSVFGGGGVS